MLFLPMMAADKIALLQNMDGRQETACFKRQKMRRRSQNVKSAQSPVERENLLLLRHTFAA